MGLVQIFKFQKRHSIRKKKKGKEKKKKQWLHVVIPTFTTVRHNIMNSIYRCKKKHNDRERERERLTKSIVSPPNPGMMKRPNYDFKCFKL